MSITHVNPALRDEIRDVLADILEVEVGDIMPTSHFQDDHGGDSMKGIEVLAALERRFGITLDQSELPRMTNLEQTYEVVAEALAQQKNA
ncbi:acyl carrier protein [Actinoplanes sp. NPDC051346]|uniref:acyl carrier protein n=1 Tax=Actinoplanes sp. NPDC051346 TaxID=3155048 RepID=UPI00341D8F85